MPTLSVPSWRNEGWQELPAWRTGITGEREEPLTLQWAGDPQTLADALDVHGWQASATWTVANVASSWASPIEAMALPVLPSLATGERPALVRVHAGSTPDVRLVLRVWEADIALAATTSAPTPVPLYVGSIVEERATRVLALVPWLAVSNDSDGPRDALAVALGVHTFDERRTPPVSGWDSRVLRAESAGRP